MLSTVIGGLLDLFWPPRTTCLICGGDLQSTCHEALVCGTCWEAIGRPPAVPCCVNCCRPLNQPQTGCDSICEECVEGSPYGRVFSLGLHEGALREAVHHLKFHGRDELGRALGHRLAERVQVQPECIVPVPLHRSRLRERGFNQAAMLGEGIGRRLGVPMVDGVLRRTRSTGHQAKLDRAGRLQNLEDAFAVAEGRIPWAGRSVLLVDDVLTTGATATAVAEVLHRTGAREINLAVVGVSTKAIKPADNNTPMN